MPSIQAVAKQALRVIDKNSPAILTGLGVAGLVSTAYLSGKASYKAAGILREYEDSTNKEKFDLVWRLFVPAIATGFAASACIIGAQSLNHARQAALISGLSIAEGTYREYRDKNVSLFGEKNDEKVRDAVAKDSVANFPPTSADYALVRPGQHLIKDQYSGRYFSGTVETVRAARNDINEILLKGDNYASLNEFYELIGLDSIPVGTEVGWNINNMLDVNFSSTVLAEGVACLVLEFRTFPEQDYASYL